MNLDNGREIAMTQITDTSWALSQEPVRGTRHARKKLAGDIDIGWRQIGSPRHPQFQRSAGCGVPVELTCSTGCVCILPS